MKTGLIFIVITSLVTIMSCKKDGVSNGTPQCVLNEIEEFKKIACTDGVKVDRYKFQGKEVYVFVPGTCGNDMTSEVIDEDCITLGYLGGIAGNTTINGDDFSKANFQKTVWKK